MPASASFNLMVVANRTCPCPGLATDVARLVDGRPGAVLVVAPALNSRLRHWVSDVDGAVRAAGARLDTVVALLRTKGIAARGEVGDADPLQAIDDAMAVFEAHAVLLSTWPEGRSHWLERDLLERARERFDVPVEHVVSHYGLYEAPLTAH